MAIRSVYLPGLERETDSDVLKIEGDEHRHLVTARAAPGEIIEAFDGRGIVCVVRVESVDRRHTLGRIVERRKVPPPEHELILGLSMVRGAAFEIAVEKAVEIGVTRIVPVVAARSNVSGPGRHDRWEKIAVEAAKQSKRYHLAAIESPLPFAKLLTRSAQTKILFAERGGGPLHSAVSGFPAICLIGPEGGWTDAEAESARASGFHLVTLGSGILKAETAAIVGAALVKYVLEEKE